jgi:redox-sensitive bicupin YhaK (pirin superfamily)
LPSKSKMVDPFFVMHWGEEVPKIVTEDGLTSGILYAGELMGKRGLPPPPHSWARDENNEVGVLHLTLKPGAKFALPPARGGQAINRQVYFLEGPELGVGDQQLSSHSIITLNAGATAVLTNPGAMDSEVLVLQGRPIGEPVVQHGPFVMNTRAEIQQTFLDYQKTQFGGKLCI